MNIYDKVRVISNNYINKGIKKGDVGYIIETYNDRHYEVEFSDENTGISYAQEVISVDDIEIVN